MRFFLVLALLAGGIRLAHAQVDTLLTQLNKAIDEKVVYEKEKQQRLKKYHHQLAGIARGNLEQQFRVQSRLAEEYKTFNYDSAFTSVQRLQQMARTMHDSVRIAYARNQLGLVLLSSGLFKETLDSLASQSMHHLPDSIRIDYYFIMGRTYYDLVDFELDRFFTPHYITMGNSYLDSAKHLCRPGSYMFTYLKALRNLKNENSQEAFSDLNQLLARKDLSLHQVAVVASTLSYFYVSREQPEQAMHLLALASIADIKNATKETTAISSLAQLLYMKGDIKNAYVFIQQAMDDALFYGARQRKVHVGATLRMIAAEQLTHVDEQRRIWLIYSSLVTVLVILVVFFAYVTYKQLKKRKIAEKALQESNKIKEEYIGYYFNANSEYLGKIEAFKKSIELKLATRKMDDIKMTVNNINLKKEREELYSSFDAIFLKLFPDFVTVFNSFFAEENKIVLKEGQLLNTELRIFALIRMGIHDNEKIAKILDYSINTIYNYKARVKGKSLLPNEEFEKKIMQIHAL